MDIEPRILVVDDEENLLRSTEKTLFREGFEVETANGNIPALTLVQEALNNEAPFDLVIVDFMNSRVVDQSALQAIEVLASKYNAVGKHIQLRHLSRDCHQLLNRAGQLMIDADDDPNYGLAVDYSVKTGMLGAGH